MAAEPALTSADLQRTIDQQQATIAALVDAAERRLVGHGWDSSYGRWEKNLVLHEEVENRTRSIRHAERLLRSVVDSFDARMCILGDHGLIIGTNRLWNEFCETRKWDVGQAGVDADFFALMKQVPGELGDLIIGAVQEVLIGGQPRSSVKGHLSGAADDDVDSEDIVVRVYPVHDHDTAKVVVSLIDITDATRTQRELGRITDEAQLLALVAQHTDNGVAIADGDGRIEWVNQAFCRMTGFRSEDLLGQRRQDLLSDEISGTVALAGFSAALVERRVAELEAPIRTKDGRERWVHIELQPIVEAGRQVRFISVERDITEQRIAAQQLQAAIRQAQLLTDELSSEKALLSNVLGSIPHLVYWKDADLRYAGVNSAFVGLRALGDADLVLRRTEAELDTDDELSAALASIEPEVLRTGQPVQNQRLLLTVPDRPVCSLLLSVLPQIEENRVSGVIGVAADVTHVSTLEQQLAQATRLESIGQLAAGIAHEINTPVQYVSDNTRFVAETFGEVLTTLQAVETLSKGPGGDAARLQELLAGVDLEFIAEEIPSALMQSQEGLARVAQIVRAMKDFSHPGQGRAEADLNRAVESTMQVSRNEWRYVAEVQLDLDPKVGLVRCYEGELKQVMLNIVVNAAQAIAEHRDAGAGEALGRIRIQTERLAHEVRITIQDDGPGMDEATRTKIFDPFFTTKAVGKGTGQGLSMAYAIIVQKHGGKFSVASEPGAGATFTIDLPDNPEE